MDSFLYTATSGASRVMKAQHVRSNNLSNADTAGFRADMERVQSKVQGLMVAPLWSPIQLPLGLMLVM